MKKQLIALILITLIQILLVHVPKAYAATSPSLETAGSYSVLAGSAVTNTGSTTISGDVGISPGTVAPNYTGFGTVTLGGSIHDADAASLTAQADKNTAFAALASEGCDTDYGGVTTELAGKNLVPGVYCSSSFHLSSGILTLNGSSSDVWIFKSASDLIISGGASAKVVFSGSGLPCNVWWRVTSTATLDANSSAVGNILADTSITFAAGASLDGRALARTAEVTLSSNSISGPTCAAPSQTPTPTPTQTPNSNSAASSNSTDANTSSSSQESGSPCIASAITTVPKIINARRTSPTSIVISWGPFEGLNTFNLRYGFENGNWLFNSNISGFSTTINDLPVNQSIWIQVAAENNCAVGSFGESVLVGGTAATNTPGFPNTGILPKLPNTGIGPQESNISAGLLVFGITVSFLYIYIKYYAKKP